MKVVLSNYLSALNKELNGKVLEIEGKEQEGGNVDCLRIQQFPDGSKKDVLNLSAGEVVLNVANKTSLIEAFGDESTDWITQKVKYTIQKVDFKGKKVDGVRLIPVKQSVFNAKGKIKKDDVEDEEIEEA